MLADVFCLLLLLFQTLSPVLANAQPLSHTAPVLKGIAHVSAPALIAVSGEGFSAGGPVLVAVVGPAGIEASLELWTFASSYDSWGPFGAGAANLEFISAGRIRAVIPLDIEPTYGPHGSQDPALGYAPADTIVALRLAMCTQGLDAQAFDARTRTWSNNIHMVAMC